jgi:hypothetical protein
MARCASSPLIRRFHVCVHVRSWWWRGGGESMVAGALLRRYWRHIVVIVFLLGVGCAAAYLLHSQVRLVTARVSSLFVCVVLFVQPPVAPVSLRAACDASPPLPSPAKRLGVQ